MQKQGKILAEGHAVERQGECSEPQQACCTTTPFLKESKALATESRKECWRAAGAGTPEDTAGSQKKGWEGRFAWGWGGEWAAGGHQLAEKRSSDITSHHGGRIPLIWGLIYTIVCAYLSEHHLNIIYSITWHFHKSWFSVHWSFCCTIFKFLLRRRRVLDLGRQIIAANKALFKINEGELGKSSFL